MKIRTGQTGIFDLELKQKLFRELEPWLQELDRTKIYDISLFFDEISIHDSEKIKGFSLPEDKRPEWFFAVYKEFQKEYGDISLELASDTPALRKRFLAWVKKEAGKNEAGEDGLILDDSVISQILSFVDLKGALRKIRRDQVLSEEGC